MDDEPPTDSHALAAESAQAEHGEPGTVKLVAATATDLHANANADNNDQQHDVQDDGWKEERTRPVVNGVPSETMSTLLRRFDNQVFRVRQIDEPPLANLDLKMAADQDFSPVKLRANLERFYTSVVVQLVALWTHIVRIRSWKEHERTSAFLAVYLVCWLLDALLPVGIVFLMALILFPRARDVCFPPLPAALAPPRTTPETARNDTVTDTPEDNAGEGAEQEAHSFMNSIASLLVSTSIGKHPQEAAQGSAPPDVNAPDVADIHAEIASGQDAAGTAAQARTKQKVSQMVWTKAGGAMRALQGATDTWERGANALSPTPPFTSSRPRMALAACLALPLAASCLLTPYMLVKGVGFTIGFLLFGDPILSRMQGTLIKHYPQYKAYLEPQNSVLRGVPTNAQLAITLLRIGELNRAPIPPPLDSTKHDAAPPKHRSGMIRFLKRITGGSINVFLSMDSVKAAAGEKHAQHRKGVVQPPQEHREGPVRFPARYKGRQGSAYITLTATSPALSWASASSPGSAHPEWAVPIADIADIAKVGGLGWKSKMMVSWALEKQVVDGLIVTTADGEAHHLTAVKMRDELFNRLVASGPQMWEAL